MLLQTNSYIVPRDKRAEHARLLRKFRQTLARLGCDTFEVYEQVGTNWSLNQTSGRFVQIIRFRDRQHQLAVQAAEQADPIAQEQISQFCQLVNLPYQQQQGMFAVGYYTAVFPAPPPRNEKAQPVVAVDEAQPAPSEKAVDAQVDTTSAEPAAEQPADSMQAEVAEPEVTEGNM
ncbi:MAG TPA: hypothetical protein VGV35_14930 [Bryobacteraceae bacterium]|nr:hypothetical protein [Bryobacteraceae bacterium]